MKEIIILASNIGNIKNKSNQFILNIIEHFYKSGIRVTVFSKSFSKNFPAYITRKHLSTLLLKKSANDIAKMSENADAIIAVDFPMNIIASMTKNILIKKNRGKAPIIVWYALKFQNHLYFYDNNIEQNKLTDKVLRKLDYEHTSNIDIIICGSNKVKEKILYLHKNIKNIEVIYPYFSPYIFLNNKQHKEKEKNIIIFYNNEESIFKCTSAYAQYLKESDDVYRLKIVGYNKDIIKNIKKLNIEQYVDFIEEDDNSKIANEIENSKAIIIHDTNDSFYTELVSAWHYKTLPIIDEKSSSAEIADDGKNALIYNSKNPISIISKIKKMAENKKTYEVFMSSANYNQNSNEILELINNYSSSNN
ncbi:glycosyltransferase [uncultured Brachyspira sp.]|uniref:glycosyltransferase n=1 Tax=uncultured Brachyspira sp. TaxID=221953 RepID=UPI0026334155|nr:glycosyltransferase [uncultured Brachyspira sp.]